MFQNNTFLYALNSLSDFKNLGLTYRLKQAVSLSAWIMLATVLSVGAVDPLNAQTVANKTVYTETTSGSGVYIIQPLQHRFFLGKRLSM